MKEVLTIHEMVECLEKLIDEQRLEVLCPFSSLGHHPGNFAGPRNFELTVAFNCLRTVCMLQKN
jgi:hypothetical protein